MLEDINFNLPSRMEQTDTSEFFLVNVGGILVLCILQAKLIAVRYCYGNE